MQELNRITDWTVSSHNEWDPLELVLVGTATGAQVPRADLSLRAINYADLKAGEKIPSGPYPDQVIDEANADLDRLAEALKSLGVEVLRPKPMDFAAEFSNGLWKTDGYYAYCPRDSVMILDNLILESPMPLRARQRETECYRSIFSECTKAGARWLSAPKPSLSDECYEVSQVHKDRLTLTEHEPAFDAANILRCDRDLLYLVSNSGNLAGAQWLQAALGRQYRVHPLQGIYSYMHIDSTISLLRPGLVLLNPERIKPQQVPDFFKNWDIIWCEKPVDIGYHGPYRHASPWIGMNLLMVNPQLAIVEQRQTALIRQLARFGIESLALPIRHARTLGGAFHCVTLDLRRRH